MSQAAVGITLGGTVGGTAVLANAPVGNTGPAAAVAHAAQAALPYTGFAFGLYLFVALALIVAGLVLRRFGVRRDPALEGPGPSDSDS